MLSVKRDAGEDFVFRAVPVVVSPTLSFSMKLNSADFKAKAPLTWATELASEKESKDLTAGKKPKQIYKAPEPKKETRTEPVSKKFEKPTSVIGKKIDKPATAVQKIKIHRKFKYISSTKKCRIYPITHYCRSEIWTSW